jgi:hypothetical protein
MSEGAEKKESFMGSSIAKLSKALSLAQGAFPSIPKTCNNPFYKSKYADLATIIDKTKGELSKNGLSITQLVMGETIATILMHESGEWIRSDISIKAIKPEPQAQGSAITYARRYALSAILNVASEDDDDANAHSSNGQKKAEPEKYPSHKAQPKQEAPPEDVPFFDETPRDANPEPATDESVCTPAQANLIHTKLKRKNITTVEPFVEKFGFTPSLTPKSMVNTVLGWIDLQPKAAA